MSAGNVGGTRSSGIVSSASDMHWMSLICGMKGVGGVCEMCMCLARAVYEARRWKIGLGLGFTNLVRTEGVLDGCLCLGCGGMDGVAGEWLGGLDQCLEGWRCVICV